MADTAPYAAAAFVLTAEMRVAITARVMVTADAMRNPKGLAVAGAPTPCVAGNALAGSATTPEVLEVAEAAWAVTGDATAAAAVAAEALAADADVAADPAAESSAFADSAAADEFAAAAVAAT